MWGTYEATQERVSREEGQWLDVNVDYLFGARPLEHECVEYLCYVNVSLFFWLSFLFLFFVLFLYFMHFSSKKISHLIFILTSPKTSSGCVMEKDKQNERYLVVGAVGE
jgi:hypothetical protein